MKVVVANAMLLSLLKLVLVLCLADIVMSQSGNIGTGVTDDAGTAITVSLGDVILIGAHTAFKQPRSCKK